MGGRGAGSKGGGGGVVSTKLPFEANAEKVFLKYGIERRGGGLEYEKRPEINDLRWINANKERLIRWKYEVDQENKRTAEKFKVASNFVVVKKEGNRYYIAEPKLERVGLKDKIVTEEKKEWGGQKAAKIWEKVSDVYGEEKTMIRKDELRRLIR